MPVKRKRKSYAEMRINWLETRNERDEFLNRLREKESELKVANNVIERLKLDLERTTSEFQLLVDIHLTTFSSLKLTQRTLLDVLKQYGVKS